MTSNHRRMLQGLLSLAVVLSAAAVRAQNLEAPGAAPAAGGPLPLFRPVGVRRRRPVHPVGREPVRLQLGQRPRRQQRARHHVQPVLGGFARRRPEYPTSGRVSPSTCSSSSGSAPVSRSLFAPNSPPRQHHLAAPTPSRSRRASGMADGRSLAGRLAPGRRHLHLQRLEQQTYLGLTIDSLAVPSSYRHTSPSPSRPTLELGLSGKPVLNLDRRRVVRPGDRDLEASGARLRSAERGGPGDASGSGRRVIRPRAA